MRQSLQWINIGIEFWLFEEATSSQKYFYGLCCFSQEDLVNSPAFEIKNRKSPFQVVVVLDRARLVKGYWVEQVTQFVQSLKKILSLLSCFSFLPASWAWTLSPWTESRGEQTQVPSGLVSEAYLSLCPAKSGSFTITSVFIIKQHIWLQLYRLIEFKSRRYELWDMNKYSSKFTNQVNAVCLLLCV